MMRPMLFAGLFRWFLELKMFKIKTLVAALLAGLSLFAAPAFAVIDVTAATAGVSDAQTAILAVLAAMITLAAAVYGVRKVLKLLGR